MYRRSFCSWVIAISALLTACGGGAGAGDPFAGQSRVQTSTVLTPLTPMSMPNSSLSQAGALVDPQNLMDSLEIGYPGYFPGHAPTTRGEGYVYRFYPGTGNYLAVQGDAVQVFGPSFGAAVLNVGRLSEFACAVFPEECPSGMTQPILRRDAVLPPSSTGQGAIRSAIVDAVRAAFPDQAPTAVASGASSSVTTGSVVSVNGLLSSDPDGDALTYSWSLAAPSTSHAFVSDAGLPQASFIPDVSGTYVVILVVSDGIKSSSTAVSVTATTTSPYCCKHCTSGKPCGDTCISISYTCHVVGGCACY
jgi:hypothetical protein